MSNSDNPRIGAEFERQVLKWLIDQYDDTFELQKEISIGNYRSTLKKPHKFDIVSLTNKTAIECKCYTWTGAGNVPSAKMGATNEAAFYLTCLPDEYIKIIVMLRSYNSKRDEFLADYYYRTNKHLLGDIKLMEYDPKSQKMRLVYMVE